jgi:hypothetical protein
VVCYNDFVSEVGVILSRFVSAHFDRSQKSGKKNCGAGGWRLVKKPMILNQPPTPKTQHPILGAKDELLVDEIRTGLFLYR